MMEVQLLASPSRAKSAVQDESANLSSREEAASSKSILAVASGQSGVLATLEQAKHV